MSETIVEEVQNQTTLTPEEEKKAEKERKKLAREEKRKAKVRVGKPHYCTNCQAYTRPVRLPKNPNRENNKRHTSNKVALILCFTPLLPYALILLIYNAASGGTGFIGTHLVCEKCHLKYDDNLDYSEKRDAYQNKRAYETSKYGNLGEMEVKVEAVRAMKEMDANPMDMVALNGDPLLVASLNQNQSLPHQKQAPQQIEAPKQTAADRLKEAHQMYKDGMLDETEFKEIKQKLMKEM